MTQTGEGYTPMVQQYMEIKKQHEDKLLFYRLGDFYELFFGDAITASRELNLTLTQRAGNTKHPIPMCGVPFHSVDGYLAKLIKKGYRIAICDQMEDPKKAVGIVKREVTKILTPGTVLSDAVLDDEHNQYLAAVSIGDGRAVLGLADVSTGEASWYEASGPYWEDLLMDQIYRMQPAELVLAPDEQLPERFLQELSQKLPQCMVNRFQKDG